MLKKILNNTRTSGTVHEIVDLKDSKEMLAKTLEKLFQLEISNNWMWFRPPEQIKYTT